MVQCVVSLDIFTRRSFILTHPTGVPKYSVTRKNIPRNYTLNCPIIKIYSFPRIIHILSYNEVNYHYRTLCLKINLFTRVVLKHSVFIFGKRHPALHNLYFVSFSPVIGSFSIDNGNCSENVSFKMNSCFFNLCCVYSNLLKMASVGEFPQRWFLENRTKV